MLKNAPQNIVEAYKLAVQASNLDPEIKLRVFDEVVSFCESNGACMKDDSIKRKTLLFWAYNRLAKANIDEGQYENALELWQKAQNLVYSPYGKIKLGNDMLDAVEKSKMPINDKAKLIIKVTALLYEAYNKTGDEENASRMERLQNVASYLLSSSKLKH
ncbi:MAG: hypothetical protein E7017_02350 [Alphaproteobacteria bacterium]|nr:hypothetical protein [Alphaproteobacteria bacterium]